MSLPLPTQPVPFLGLYREATTVQERLSLINLAKQHFIHVQDFEEACRYREIEKLLKAKIEEVVATLGVDALNPKDLCPTPTTKTQSS